METIKSGVGRPNKKGLDYFAHLVRHTDEETILFQKYGCIGYAVYYILRGKIAENGYCYQLNKRKLILLCSRFQIKESVFDEILEYAIELELFDKTIYETYSVLTSIRVQVDYILAAHRRKRIDFCEEYYLLTYDIFLKEVGDIKLYDKIKLFAINVDTNSINADINSINVDTNSQRKRKSNSKEIEKEKQPAPARSVGKRYEKESAERENKGKPIDIFALSNAEFSAMFLE